MYRKSDKRLQISFAIASLAILTSCGNKSPRKIATPEKKTAPAQTQPYIPSTSGDLSGGTGACITDKCSIVTPNRSEFKDVKSNGFFGYANKATNWGFELKDLQGRDFVIGLAEGNPTSLSLEYGTGKHRVESVKWTPKDKSEGNIKLFFRDVSRCRALGASAGVVNLSDCANQEKRIQGFDTEYSYPYIVFAGKDTQEEKSWEETLACAGAQIGSSYSGTVGTILGAFVDGAFQNSKDDKCDTISTANTSTSASTAPSTDVAEISSSELNKKLCVALHGTRRPVATRDDGCYCDDDSDDITSWDVNTNDFVQACFNGASSSSLAEYNTGAICTDLGFDMYQGTTVGGVQVTDPGCECPYGDFDWYEGGDHTVKSFAFKCLLDIDLRK